ncbi:hypothetical protein [Burkholderia gladioli]|uniref:hypothetical protein n=1 Tax=Burkholderia gladioli TaxID=28095 RepID=UPI00164154C2|nr:hypothetical protein [Burkholderia gladioli]
MTSSLQNWLNQHEPTSSLLYWCHTTNMTGLRQILRDGALGPQKCNVFEMDLSYFFYGRPAYRLKGDPSLLDNHAWPIIFVLKNTIEDFAWSAFPFDSGAFQNGLYQQWLDPTWDINAFRIDIPNTTHARHIAAFYDSNEDYLDGKGKQLHPSNFGFNLEAAAISQMIRECRGGDADDRRFTIEMIADNPIPLNSQYVAMVIVPREVADSQELRPLSSCGIHVYPYRVITHLTASQHHAHLENTIFEHQKEEGLL